MITLTEDQKLAIKTAEAIQKRIDAMYDEIDELLEPIAKLGTASKDPTEIRALADVLPRGFYRSELRTWAFKVEMDERQ